MKKKRKGKNPDSDKLARAKIVMTEAEAALAIARFWLTKGSPYGFNEGSEGEQFEVVEASFDDDGQYFVTINLHIPNLDIELASTGEHIDQAEINAHHKEP